MGQDGYPILSSLFGEPCPNGEKARSNVLTHVRPYLDGSGSQGHEKLHLRIELNDLKF